MNISYFTRYSVVIIQLILLVVTAGQASAWNDRTHMAVVEAAGAEKLSYLAVGADMAKERAPVERLNHYCNNPKGTVVTANMILGQVPYFSTAEPESGHLYGAIIASLETYREQKKNPSKYALYPLGYAMHYLGDLSMPLHNMEYGSFNKLHHGRNDNVVENDPKLVQEIRSLMGKYPVKIDPQKFRDSLVAEVAAIAGRSIALSYQLQESKTSLMSKATAYEQLAQSASLLRAVLIALEVPVSDSNN
ncbi:hypothetical protein OR1_02696 [Geobacter sp. OR-1]|uniref:hypothetical protein n=1 Tax=Geobacter sp. OR-1 TaxID=1266765 RepID=UPI000541BC8F|nr:hypothetical protein [Geobacter sp. OR-1]GAM10407.1 hypothetical protein OR1_02696 [Geobacter sp. OR-1]